MRGHRLRRQNRTLATIETSEGVLALADRGIGGYRKWLNTASDSQFFTTLGKRFPRA